MRNLLLQLYTLSCFLPAGCLMLGPGGTAEQALELIKLQNVRGCIYARASTTSLASGSLLVIGTFGPDPPAYSECWQGLPSGIP